MTAGHRASIALGSALSLGVLLAAVPITFAAFSLVSLSAHAAPAKKIVRPSAKAKPPVKGKAGKAGKGKAGKKAMAAPKAASAKAAKIKTGRAALTPRELIDAEQFAPGLIDTAGRKSPLELLAAYKTSASEGDLESAAVLLRLATGEPVNHTSVVAANDLVGIALDTQDTAGLVELGGTPRTQMAVGLAESSSPGAPVEPGARVSFAHAAVTEVLHGSALTCLSAYKLAAGRGDADSAAFALACANRAPVDEADVEQANELLGIQSPMPASRLVTLAARTAGTSR